MASNDWLKSIEVTIFMSIENRASVEFIDPALAYTRFFHALNVHAAKLH